MSDGIQAYVRSLRTLTRQLEELQLLRDRVRRAELKAIYAWRYQRRRRMTRRGSLLRHRGGCTEGAPQSLRVPLCRQRLNDAFHLARCLERAISPKRYMICSPVGTRVLDLGDNGSRFHEKPFH